MNFFKNWTIGNFANEERKKKNQSTLIWSNKSELSDIFSSSVLGKKNLIEVLNEKTYGFLGRVKKINSLQVFPLSAHINEKFYEKKVVYVGDAAHSIHPIAGQGWNLGLRDVKSLTGLLKEAKENNLDIGSNFFFVGIIMINVIMTRTDYLKSQIN